jgi:hypothetical protein
MLINVVRMLPGLAILGMFGLNAQASTVSYYLDQSNALAEPVNYLLVTIDDEGAAGDVNFTVEILQPLIDIADSGFGIASFGFNLTSGVPFTGTISGPDDWTFDLAMNEDGFGVFDVVVERAFSGVRQSPALTFSISGVDGDVPLDYVALSSVQGGQQGPVFFAALVGGFEELDPDGSGGHPSITSAYFGGSTLVPLPAAFWLFSTALLGLLGISRRYRTN